MTRILADLTLPGNVLLQDPENFAFRTFDIGAVIVSLLDIILAFAGMAFLLMMLSAGFTFLTSTGDPKKVEMAKQRLTNAVIGFILIIAAFWIVQIAGRIFGIDEIVEIFG